MNISEKLTNILHTYKNDYSGGEDPTVIYFYKILEKLPDGPVNAALDEYFLFPPSQFYDQGYLISLIQKYIAIETGHLTADDALTLLKQNLREHGSRRVPCVPELLHSIISRFGGWERFIDNVSDKEFLQVYNNMLNNITKGVILDAIAEIN